MDIVQKALAPFPHQIMKILDHFLVPMSENIGKVRPSPPQLAMTPVQLFFVVIFNFKNHIF